MNICVICSGNICRSPFVEQALKCELGPPHKICSAGTLGINGSNAYIECIRLAPSYGLSLSEHISQGITRQIVEDNDLLVCLTQEHINALLHRKVPEHKLKLLSDFLPEGEEFSVGRLGVVRKGTDIPDPMGRPAEIVRPVLDVLEIASKNLAAFAAQSEKEKK